MITYKHLRYQLSCSHLFICRPITIWTDNDNCVENQISVLSSMTFRLLALLHPFWLNYIRMLVGIIVNFKYNFDEHGVKKDPDSKSKV